MGIGDKIKKFVTGATSEEEKQIEEQKEQEYEGTICALCQKTGADKKWGGQYWHKKCYRKMRGKARGML